MIHLWHEDSANSFTSMLLQFLVNNKFNSNEYKFEVKGSNGNSELVKRLVEHNFIDGDIYIVFVDNPDNNISTLRVFNDIVEIANMHKNVYVANIECFESILLKFKLLREWTRPLDEPYIDRYDRVYKIVEIFLSNNWVDSSELKEYIKIKYSRDIRHVSSEKIYAWLLNDLLRNSRAKFGVSKTKLGECWTCDCCSLKYGDGAGRFCTLMDRWYSRKVKAYYIYEYTCISDIITGAVRYFESNGIKRVRK